MRERDLVLDLTKVPRCHRCGAAPEAERDRCGCVHFTWRHEHDCPVPDSNEERARFAAALALALGPARFAPDRVRAGQAAPGNQAVAPLTRPTNLGRDRGSNPEGGCV
jgi:hypothetical protein